MKLEKRDTDIFLTLWIKNDPELWSELRDIHIKLLTDRIVNEMSYKELAQEYGTTTLRIKEIFEVILQRIDRNISSEIAKHLRIINAKLNARPDKPFSTVQVFLN